MPPKWCDEGEEPDYRFTLANERTFLAWLRTALALLAGAVALTQLVAEFPLPWLRTGLAVLLTGAGTVLATSAYLRWAAVQKAMRRGGTLPHTRLPGVAGVITAAVGMVVLVVVLVGTR